MKGKKLGYELNHDLIHKTTLLLGIKGYYTNIKEEVDSSKEVDSSNKNELVLSNQEIIRHYKNLWHVEKAFRISKSDLKVRPIFHNKGQAIETHILICFMALAISTYIEIKSGKSIKSAIKELKQVTDARMYDPIGKREVVKRSKIDSEMRRFLRKIEM